MTCLLDYVNSEKNFKLVKTTVTAYDNTRENTLHEDEAGNHFDPIIKVYSLM